MVPIIRFCQMAPIIRPRGQCHWWIVASSLFKVLFPWLIKIFSDSVNLTNVFLTLSWCLKKRVLVQFVVCLVWFVCMGSFVWLKLGLLYFGFYCFGLFCFGSVVSLVWFGHVSPLLSREGLGCVGGGPWRQGGPANLATINLGNNVLTISHFDISHLRMGPVDNAGC